MQQRFKPFTNGPKRSRPLATAVKFGQVRSGEHTKDAKSEGPTEALLRLARRVESVPRSPRPEVAAEVISRLLIDRISNLSYSAGRQAKTFSTGLLWREGHSRLRGNTSENGSSCQGDIVSTHHSLVSILHADLLLCRKCCFALQVADTCVLRFAPGLRIAIFRQFSVWHLFLGCEPRVRLVSLRQTVNSFGDHTLSFPDSSRPPANGDPRHLRSVEHHLPIAIEFSMRPLVSGCHTKSFDRGHTRFEQHVNKL